CRPRRTGCRARCAPASGSRGRRRPSRRATARRRSVAAPAVLISASSPRQRTIMQVPQSAMLLRIFTGERDRAEGQALYNATVPKARELHIAGPTGLRGHLGYGRSTRTPRASVLEMSEDLPIVVEIVDAEERIAAFLPVLDQMIGTHSALVT